MSKRLLVMITLAALALMFAIGAVMAQGTPHPHGALPGMKAPAGEAPKADPAMSDEDADGDWMAADDEFDMDMLDDDDAPVPPVVPGMGGQRAPGMPGMGMRMGMGMHRAMAMHMGGHGAFEGLDLTKAQRDKMADLHERQMRLEIRSRADLQLARLDLMKALHSETANRASIDQQIDRIAKMRADQQKARIGTFLEARSLLTEEQRTRLREGGPMRMRIRERMREGSQ